jgi:hypothetical protein
MRKLGSVLCVLSALGLAGFAARASVPDAPAPTWDAGALIDVLARGGAT